MKIQFITVFQRNKKTINSFPKSLFEKLWFIDQFIIAITDTRIQEQNISNDEKIYQTRLNCKLSLQKTGTDSSSKSNPNEWSINSSEKSSKVEHKKIYDCANGLNEDKSLKFGISSILKP
jgi:hypothetical protein